MNVILEVYFSYNKSDFLLFSSSEIELALNKKQDIDLLLPEKMVHGEIPFQVSDFLTYPKLTFGEKVIVDTYNDVKVLPDFGYMEHKVLPIIVTNLDTGEIFDLNDFTFGEYPNFKEMCIGSNGRIAIHLEASSHSNERGEIILIDLRKRQVNGRIQLLGGGFNEWDGAFDPHGRLFVYRDYDTLRIIDFETAKILFEKKIPHFRKDFNFCFNLPFLHIVASGILLSVNMDEWTVEKIVIPDFNNCIPDYHQELNMLAWTEKINFDPLYISVLKWLNLTNGNSGEIIIPFASGDWHLTKFLDDGRLLVYIDGICLADLTSKKLYNLNIAGGARDPLIQKTFKGYKLWFEENSRFEKKCVLSYIEFH